MRFRLKTTVFAAIAGGVCLLCSADTLRHVSANAAPFSARGRGMQEYSALVAESAKAALNAGMPSLAKSVLQENISKHSFLRDSNPVNELLTDSLIALGEYAAADAVFARISDASSPANKIRGALIKCGLGDGELAKAGIADLDENSVPENLKAWLYIARGYAFFETGKNASALAEFDKAKSCAKNSPALADAEVGANLSKLASPLPKEELTKLEAELAGKVSLLLGTPEGFQTAKQYAAVLFRLGKDAQALDVVNQQLEISLAPEIDKDELKIISASMTKDPQKQIAMLRNILRSTSSADVARFSVSLVSSNRKVSNTELEAFLKDVLENSPVKSKDFILLELAKVEVKKGDRTGAVAYAQELLDKYPESKLASGALRILAWGAFTAPAPQYRLAASYLDRLAALLPDSDERAYTKYVSATCYFFDKDYATAAKIYGEVFDKIPQRRGAIINRIVESFINLGDEAKAVEVLDRAYGVRNIDEESLWNAEWRVISLYRAGGRTREALERIEKAINSTEKISPLLKMRMMWIRAVISEASGDAAKTAAYCDNVIDMASAEDVKPADLAAEIAANAMLLKAASLERGGAEFVGRAIDVYEALRRDFPQTAAVPFSYLHEARAEAQRGRFDKACKLCLSLAENTKDSGLRYRAVFDAAEYMRKTASESSYRSALSLLDSLCIEYPDDQRNFYSRLSQADILRLLNSFADARKLYNEIINRFGKHPEIYLAWLGLGDSILTQPDRASDAAAIFERLYSLPDIPAAAKAEAAYKWAFALAKSGKKLEADEVAWLTANALLKIKPADELLKYWVGRSLLNLAQSLEERALQRDAKAAYSLIAEMNLPSAGAARKKISSLKKE